MLNVPGQVGKREAPNAQLRSNHKDEEVEEEKLKAGRHHQRYRTKCSDVASLGFSSMALTKCSCQTKQEEEEEEEEKEEEEKLRRRSEEVEKKNQQANLHDVGVEKLLLETLPMIYGS